MVWVVDGRIESAILKHDDWRIGDLGLPCCIRFEIVFIEMNRITAGK